MKELSVLYVTDENFAPIVGVSMTSLFENNPADEIALTVYILTTNMGKKNQSRFEQLGKKYQQKIHIIGVGDQLKKIERLNLAQYRGSAMTNLRLCFDKYIPQHVQRLLYIDADTIICGSINHLADMSMNDKMLGMVCDAYGDIVADSEHKDGAYYNAGVILIDCEKWRKGMWRKRIIKYINRYGAQFAHPDQDIFNIVCKHEIVRLPICYNLQPVHQIYKDKVFFRHLGKNDYYSVEEVEKGRENPVILHMARVFGRNPWHKNNKHPHYEQYKKYKNMSCWRKSAQEKNKIGLLIGIEILLDKILPQGIFFPISLWAIKRYVVK